MELILISSPVSIPDEFIRLNDYFHQGLKRFHLRKPYYSKEKLDSFLRRVDPRFYPYIALHSHHSLSDEYGLQRLHYPEDVRFNILPEILAEKVADGKIISTSTHTAEAFKNLSDLISYAFLGPVYPSISKKGYGEPFDANKWNKIKNKSTKAIAIGGITCNNIRELKKLGFSGTAILGAIWSQPHDSALEQLSACINNSELTYHE